MEVFGSSLLSEGWALKQGDVGLWGHVAGSKALTLLAVQSSPVSHHNPSPLASHYIFSKAFWFFRAMPSSWRQIHASLSLLGTFISWPHLQEQGQRKVILCDAFMAKRGSRAVGNLACFQKPEKCLLLPVAWFSIGLCLVQYMWKRDWCYCLFFFQVLWSLSTKRSAVTWILQLFL